MSTGIGGAPADQEDPRADLVWGTVPRLVEDAALRHGSAEALVDGELRLTYTQLAEEVDRYARAFMAERCRRRRPGGRVGAQLRRMDARRTRAVAGRRGARAAEHAVQGR